MFGRKKKIQLSNESKKALKIAVNELKYFIRLYAIATELDKLANREYKQNLPKKMQKGSMLEKIRNVTKKFKDIARREQLYARVSKLKAALDAADKKNRGLYGISSTINDRRGAETSYSTAHATYTKYANQMTIFEGRVLVDIVQGLEPLINSSNPDWEKARKITHELVEDLRALTILNKYIQNFIKNPKL